MRAAHRLPIGWLGAVLALALASAPVADFVAHEWGTFTTHHGSDGEPVVWMPLQQESDLPSVVLRASSRATRKNTPWALHPRLARQPRRPTKVELIGEVVALARGRTLG